MCDLLTWINIIMSNHLNIMGNIETYFISDKHSEIPLGFMNVDNIIIANITF